MAEEVKTARGKFKFWAFISYSNTDRKWANWLHNALETYRVPKRLVGMSSREGPIPSRLLPIFRDRDELSTSANLGNSIRQALTESRFLVVICSPHAARSRWVNEEILTFKRLGREDYILSLIVEGEPNASDGNRGFPVEAECFPSGLRFKVGANGELTDERTEPIAADARETADGRAAAKLKLIAGILQIEYDLLRQRELARKVRRLKMVLSAAAMFIVLLGGLTLYAFSQRREAEARRLEAETELYRSSILLADSLGREGKTELAEESLWRTREDVRGWEWGYLLAQCHPDLGRFSIPGEGSFRATSSPDGAVGLFWKNETGTGKEEKEVAPNTLSLLRLSREGVPLRRELALSGDVVTTKWSADGNRLLVVTDSEWVIFDGAGEKVLARAKHSDANAANFIDSAGRVFVLSSGGGWSLLQEKDGNYEIAETVKAENSWDDVVGDGHGQRWVFLSETDGQIEINSVREGKLASKVMTWPSDAAFSPDGQRLAVTSREESVVLWDARRSKSTFTTIAQGIFTSRRQTNRCEIKWSGEQLLMRSIRGLRVWDLAPDGENKGENRTPQLPAVAVTMAACAKWIALGLESGQIEVLGRASFEPVTRLGGHRGKVSQLRIVDDALFSVGEDGTMRVWKLIKAVWSTDGPATDWPGDFLWKESAALQAALTDSQFRLFSSAHRGSVTLVSRAPTINRIASTGSDGVVRIWDVSAERILLTLQGFGVRGEAIVFDRTGLLLGASFFTPGIDQSWNVVWRAMPYRREELGFLGADWRTAFQQWKEREFRRWWTSTRAGK